MADGGASTFIMLVTALLVSGTVSAFLITEWNQFAREAGESRKGMVADSETSCELIGDLSRVQYDTGAQEIYIHIQNTNSRILDETGLVLILDGQQLSGNLSTTITPSGVWAEGSVGYVEIKGPSTWAYSDGDDVSLSIVCSSTVTNGVRGIDTINQVVRLDVI